MRKILLTIIFSSALAVSAQVAFKTVTDNKAGMFPIYVEFQRGQEPLYKKGIVYGVTSTKNILLDDAILVGKENDVNGMEHVRYQQKLRNIPIEGAIYLMHLANGKIISENGKWIQTFPSNLAAASSISERAALNNALAHFAAKTYKWESQDEEEFIKKETNIKTATFFPSAQLVYYSGEDDINPAELRLAYKFDIYAAEPLDRKIYFIDAVTGSVLGTREMIHTANASGTASTAYSGNQTIISDKYNNSYRLRETGRGNGIQTFNMKKGTNYNYATDFVDTDNSWNNVNSNLDQYATDAHWGAEKTYDYYKNNFYRNSIDNKGFAIKSYVHYSTNYFNAFWDGSRMTYGDGNSQDNYKPLTSLDACGHEITHGLTSFTANLNYSGESGALNEGFSDIFGTAIEFYARPTKANWLIGSDFLTIRNMANPNQYKQPDTYKGTYWYTGTGDNGGVHTNGGVLNYWFYLLAKGGSGTNDKGKAFTVAGISLPKAAAIAYRTLTVYLVSTSLYTDARFYSIKAATDLYGSGSNEVAQTINAWVAVGVGVATPSPVCTDNYESNESKTTAKAIPVNTDLTATISTTTDKDWFSFSTTSANPKVKVDLSNLVKDYDIALYNSTGTQLVLSQNGGATSETIVYNEATTASTYYIQVYGYNGNNSTACYLLRVNTSGAAFLGSDANKGLITVKDNERYKENPITLFPNPASNTISLHIKSNISKNKVFTIIDFAGRVMLKQLCQVQKGDNAIKLNLPKLAKGTYFLRVEGSSIKKFEVVQ